MKKTLTLMVSAMLVMSAVSCGSATTDAGVSVPDENILHVNGMIDAKDSLADVYDYADYVVVCEVTAKGNSYLGNGKELDTTLPKEEIMEQLIAIRTPYEITVKESYKGGLEIGDKYTVVSLEGVLDGYAVDAGLPDLEVGETYFMPICVSDPDESIPYFPALAKVNEPTGLAKLANSNPTITPLMFDTPFENVSNLDALDGVMATMNSTEKK